MSKKKDRAWFVCRQWADLVSRHYASDLEAGRALKADPNHVLTWNYYGLWQIEQGNREQAQYHLSRIAAICGTDCEHYRSLAAALEQPPGTGLVY